MPRPIRAVAAIEWLANRNPLAVVVWADPVVESMGHPVRSVYVETYWLPALGPSATWLLRRLAAWLEASPGGVRVELTELARELGLGAGLGRSSPLIRTLARLAQFNAAAPAGDAYAVRRFLAPLPRRLAAQLPPRLAGALSADQRPPSSSLSADEKAPISGPVGGGAHRMDRLARSSDQEDPT